MSLTALQHAFQGYVLQGADGIAERIEPGPLANHRRRLAIYYDAYRLRLVEALDGPVADLHVRQLGHLGEARLRELGGELRSVREAQGR